MSPNIEWTDVALRLALTLLAGGIVGLNRGEHGRPAGLRTTMLVCLAASAAMIQMNLLLSMHGKAPDSFITNDLMRLPLGILSGMGFIGGGAILRRGNMVVGVTTAATLWYVTVMGLCIGGGQIGLGMTLLAIAVLILWVLKWIEALMIQDRRATLSLKIGDPGPTRDEIRNTLTSAGVSIRSCTATYEHGAKLQHLRCLVQWRARASDLHTPAVVDQLAATPGIVKVRWKPAG
ncbi:MAG TPA: MgtC/SapB family protein [Pirellulales bacterium]|nr:MgtC/SapB family protein [Pirellulales bacterium]